jgi:hypothetical protein
LVDVAEEKADAVYPVMALPPEADGAAHSTSTAPPVDARVAMTEVGAPGPVAASTCATRGEEAIDVPSALLAVTDT